jgi:hypothetical protein
MNSKACPQALLNIHGERRTVCLLSDMCQVKLNQILKEPVYSCGSSVSSIALAFQDPSPSQASAQDKVVEHLLSRNSFSINGRDSFFFTMVESIRICSEELYIYFDGSRMT